MSNCCGINNNSQMETPDDKAKETLLHTPEEIVNQQPHTTRIAPNSLTDNNAHSQEEFANSDINDTSQITTRYYHKISRQANSNTSSANNNASDSVIRSNSPIRPTENRTKTLEYKDEVNQEPVKTEPCSPSFKVKKIDEFKPSGTSACDKAQKTNDTDSKKSKSEKIETSQLSNEANTSSSSNKAGHNPSSSNSIQPKNEVKNYKKNNNLKKLDTNIPEQPPVSSSSKSQTNLEIKSNVSIAPSLNSPSQTSQCLPTSSTHHCEKEPKNAHKSFNDRDHNPSSSNSIQPKNKVENYKKNNNLKKLDTNIPEQPSVSSSSKNQTNVEIKSNVSISPSLNSPSQTSQCLPTSSTHHCEKEPKNAHKSFNDGDNNPSAIQNNRTNNQLPSEKTFAQSATNTDNRTTEISSGEANLEQCRNSTNPSVDLSKVVNIDGISSEIEIAKLSITQMKTILTNEKVNYKDLTDRKEFTEKLKFLWLFNQKQKSGISDGNASEGPTCKICMSEPINCVFLECGHMMSCIDCSSRIKECPICKYYITRVVRVFPT